MLKKLLKTQFCFFIITVLLAGIFLNVNNAYAVYEGARSKVSWNKGSGMCNAGDFSFDALKSNVDVNWEVANPVCAAFIASSGLAMVVAGQVTEYMCVAQNFVGLSKAASEKAGNPIPDLPFLSPSVGYKLLYRSSVLCAGRIGEYGILQSATVGACIPPGTPICVSAITQAALASSDMSRCCIAYSSYAASVAASVAALAIIYATAKGAYEKGRVCGHNWNGWKKFDVNGDPVSEGEDGIWRSGPYEGSYQYCLESIFVYNDSANSNPCGFDNVDGVPYNELSLRNKYYREYLYGGREYKDNSCSNPKSWSNEKKKEMLGYGDDAADFPGASSSSGQRYYMKGPGAAGNYACHRFLVSSNPKFDVEASKAYDCCKERSQTTICIENAPLIDDNYEHKFCKFGSKCSVKAITFDIFYAKSKSDYLCAKTYSVCPYNHNLGGGSEYTKYEENADGQPTYRAENFCQVMKHCAKVPITPYVRMTNLKGAFISSACKDLRGDSQNVYSFESELLPTGNARGFSAPIAQCFKETVQNLLLNRAGDTKCRNPDEMPNHEGNCESGYFYAKGQDLVTKSPFADIQDKLRWIIKMALTLSIAFFGAMVLLGMQPIAKKQILGYIIKISLLMYFALGNAWQFGLIDGVLETSSTLGSIMMRIDDDKPENMRDGCSFPRYNHKLLPSDPARYDNPKYPEGLEYLQIWDVLDCKLMRALGYGPDVSVPNLVISIFAGFLTGGLGILFVVATFFFAFFFLSLILRALHIFLLSTVAIVILIYVSPIVFTCILFQKTKSIFDNWLKQLIGLVLQPVILFAYLGIFISIFEYVIIGNVEYRGDGLKVPKEIVCSGEAKDKSIYCIFRIANFKTFSGLEPIGLSVPILTSMNKEKLNTIIKAGILMFIFSNFMDQVSTLAAKLVGGSKLKSSTPGMVDMGKEAFEKANGVRKRGTRLAKKAIKSTARTGFNIGKTVTALALNKGKSVAKDAPASGQAVDAAESAPREVSQVEGRTSAATNDAASKKDESEA